jgi:hypothetical protein
MKKKKKAKTAPKKKKAKPAKKKTVRAKVKTPKKRAKPAKSARKKAPKKKARAKKETPASGVVPPPNSQRLGRVEDYFAKIGVAALTLEKPVSVGARLHILGHTTNFEQTLGSMQIDHVAVTDAKAGDSIGIKVTARARGGDYVFLILS